MSTLFDMISAIVAFLMSAALLHFGGSAAARPENPPAEVSRPHADDSSASTANQRESKTEGERESHAAGSHGTDSRL